MITCPNCGGDNPGDSLYCMFCAHSLTANQTGAQPKAPPVLHSPPVIAPPPKLESRPGPITLKLKPKSSPESKPVVSQPAPVMVTLSPKPKSQPAKPAPPADEVPDLVVPPTPVIEAKPKFKLSDMDTVDLPGGPKKPAPGPAAPPAAAAPAPITLKPKIKSATAAASLPVPVVLTPKAKAPPVAVAEPPPAPKAPPAAESKAAEPIPGPGMQICPQCKTELSVSFGFCHVCGQKLTKSAPVVETAPVPGAPEPAPPPPKPLFYLFREGAEQPILEFKSGKQLIGTEGDAQFAPDDPYLSSKHALVRLGENGPLIHPKEGTNGVFLRVLEPHALHEQDEIWCAGHLFVFSQRLVRSNDAGLAVDGAVRRLGAPVPAGFGRLTHLIDEGGEGCSWILFGEQATVGRKADLAPAGDPAMPGLLFTLRAEGEKCLLAPAEPPVFIRLHEETPLRDGDQLLAGRQLLVVRLK